MSKVFTAAAVLGLLAAVYVPSSEAHHSFAMYDQSKTFTWQGTVKKFQWTNPHCHIFILGPPNRDNPDTVGDWDIEAAAPNILTRQGWNRDIVKAGDKITVVGHPVRSGEKTAALLYAVIDGKKLYNNTERPGNAPPADLPATSK